MASNYPPQGPGQPDGQPGGQPGNYGSPYGQPGNQPPRYGQAPQYSQPNSQPYGQPPGAGQNYNQPPAAPTQPGYGPPPPGGYYGPPPGAGQYNPPQGTRPPYPQQPGYLPQQAVKPQRAKAKSSRGTFIAIGIVAVIVIVSVVLGLLGVFNNIDATDYPNATKGTLTSKGTDYVNARYNNKQSDNDNRKVFVTADSQETIFKYYRDDLTKKGWTFAGEGILGQLPANQYTRESKLLYVIVGDSSQDMVQNAAGKNFIILLTGDKI